MMSNTSSGIWNVTAVSMTQSTDYYDYFDEVYIHFASRFFTVLYSLLFVVGFLGNMLVLWVILRTAQIKSMTDVSLLNLVMADLLLIFSLPFRAHYGSGEWVTLRAMCTLVLSVYYIGFYANIFFIVLMSIDRYLAIVHAVFALRIQTKSYGILASIVIWIIAIAASFPELYISLDIYDNVVFCTVFPTNFRINPDLTSTAFIKMNVLGLVIPLSIVGFCYSMVLWRLQRLHTSKKLAIRLVVVVMVVFFCYWTPYNIAVFLKVLEMKQIFNPVFELSQRIKLMLLVTEAMAYLHTCLNPFLYVFVGEKFRKHLTQLLCQTPCFKV